MNDWPARIDPEEAAVGRPTAIARRLVEASVSLNTAPRLCRRAPTARRLARRARAPRCDSGRLPRRAPRRRPGLLKRLDDGRRGLLPREARRSAGSVRRTDRQGARRLPADRRRSRAAARRAPFSASDLAAVLATCHRPRRRGRGHRVRLRWPPSVGLQEAPRLRARQGSMPPSIRGTSSRLYRPHPSHRRPSRGVIVKYVHCTASPQTLGITVSSCRSPGSKSYSR